MQEFFLFFSNYQLILYNEQSSSSKHFSIDGNRHFHVLNKSGKYQLTKQILIESKICKKFWLKWWRRPKPLLKELRISPWDV